MKRILIILVLLLLGAALWIGIGTYREISRFVSEDPTVWESAVRAFEEEDADHPPPADAILFAGSSSIRLWRSLAEDMAPLVTIRRGVGGAKVRDIHHYADRLIAPYRPRALVLFIGSNDLSSGIGNAPKSPESVAAAYGELVAQIHSALPALPIYFIAIRPTRYGVAWDEAQRTNALVREQSRGDPRLHFIDANEGLLGPNGEADAALLLWDRIHLNRKGYAAWAPPIRERLRADLGASGGATR